VAQKRYAFINKNKTLMQQKATTTTATTRTKRPR
jgi:hypothetical protein